MDDATIGTTRRGLHAVAELVLAGPQYRRTGTIRLVVSPGGFATWTESPLAVDGVDLLTGGGRLPMSGTTCAALGRAVGVTAAGPAGVYGDGSGVPPDEVLELDAAVSRWLEACWAAGDVALRRIAPNERPILWPEHLDVAVIADGIGYGVSPGDALLPHPYAYVSPPEPLADPFWNAPFGAAHMITEPGGADPDELFTFFAEGRQRAGQEAPP